MSIPQSLGLASKMFIGAYGLFRGVIAGKQMQVIANEQTMEKNCIAVVGTRTIPQSGREIELICPTSFHNIDTAYRFQVYDNEISRTLCSRCTEKRHSAAHLRDQIRKLEDYDPFRAIFKKVRS
jgi:hypothetical protein